jgi:hypothetical protein
MLPETAAGGFGLQHSVRSGPVLELTSCSRAQSMATQDAGATYRILLNAYTVKPFTFAYDNRANAACVL